MANTGVDPLGGYMEFIKKDVVRNIDMNRDSDLLSNSNSLKQLSYQEFKNKWAIGTTKATRNKVDEEGRVLP